MKQKWLVLCALMLCLVMPCVAAQADETIDTIMAAHATKTFTGDAVTEDELETIVAAGAKAPSARNLQPWHFTVIQDADVIGRIARESNGALIVISGQAGDGDGMNVDFDCGLATQNMYLAAHALRLGANIEMGGVSQANDMRDTLGIPEGYEALMILRVGHVEADATSEATTREDLSDKVNYVK